MLLILLHLLLALTLFWIVNWIGDHSTEFGYSSTSLFEDPNDSLAFNFFIRSFSPAVYIVIISAALVATGNSDLRIGIFGVSVLYYMIRLSYIFALGRHELISWTQFSTHTISGLVISWLSYEHLILPNRSLLPNLDTVGNELWLAIFAFLYAIANKAKLSSEPSTRRKNKYILRRVERIRSEYGEIVDERIIDDSLKLIAFSIIVYEDYSRPPFARLLERVLFWRKNRTTGIMQFSSPTPLSDKESVILGVDKLVASWDSYANEEYAWQRVRSTIADYNKDDDYINRVQEVMHIIDMRFSEFVYVFRHKMAVG